MRKVFIEGELLPMVGGPLDGHEAPVQIIFPFLDGGAPNSLIRFDGGLLGKLWYSLDEEGRRWVYAIEAQPSTPPKAEPSE